MTGIVKNAAGRLVPTEINGKASMPFQGVNGYRPKGNKMGPPLRSCADYPADGNKVVGSLREALEACGVQNGSAIGTHHHFRNGDFVANAVFDELEQIGSQGPGMGPVGVVSVSCADDSSPRLGGDASH